MNRRARPGRAVTHLMDSFSVSSKDTNFKFEHELVFGFKIVVPDFEKKIFIEFEVIVFLSETVFCLFYNFTNNSTTT